jgi:hypothetical protein
MICVTLFSACEKSGGELNVSPADVWASLDSASITLEKRERLSSLLSGEVTWAQRMAQSKVPEGTSLGEDLGRLDATTRALYCLVAEAKQRCLMTGAVRMLGRDSLMILARPSSRIDDYGAIVVGHYPGIGAVAFRVDRGVEPLAYEVISVAATESLSLPAAREFAERVQRAQRR